jgi:pimeloyl-ACP methyl ester carboxylesterase
MSISGELGERRVAQVWAGTIEYRERGTGPPIVFVHGVGVNGDFWRHVVPRLADRYRCIAPDLPWGSHSTPVRANADLSLPGMARITAEFLQALDLENVTIVANDTGGAVSQVLVGSHPERIGRLVLTSCDAFDKFPPTPQRYLKVVARSRTLVWLLASSLRFRFIQRLPIAYGFATSKPMPPEIMQSFTSRMRRNRGVRRDIRRMLQAVDNRYTIQAAERLPAFDRPALVLWADNDRLFPRDHGRRLAALLPRGEFETIANSRTLIPEQQPDHLADRLREWLSQAAPSDE